MILSFFTLVFFESKNIIPSTVFNFRNIFCINRRMVFSEKELKSNSSSFSIILNKNSSKVGLGILFILE